MGYYTDFSLEVWPSNRFQEVKDRIYDRANYDVFDGEPRKWYSYEKDITEVSKELDDVLIQVSGEGEESGDIWTSAYLAGQKVFAWELEAKIPSPPQELIDKVTAMDRDRINQRQQALQKLTEQERRLLGLEE